MLIDAQTWFVAPGSPLSLVGGAGVDIPSPNTIDLLGQGVGTAPQNIIGTATTFGEDVGIGDPRVQVEAVVGTAFTTSNSCTLNVAFQAAADQGAAGNYQPSTWNTLVETGPIAVARLTAGKVIARFDYPPAFPDNLNPRYLRLLFDVPAGANFTAGTILFAISTMVRDDQANKNAARNYVVA